MHPLIQTHIGCHINHVPQTEQCENTVGWKKCRYHGRRFWAEDIYTFIQPDRNMKVAQELFLYIAFYTIIL